MRAQLSVVEPTSPEPYPLPRDFRMPTHYFVAWWHNRWLNSTLHLTGSYEVQGVAVALYSIAQNQSPMGTLPRDDLLLARMLRLDTDAWADLQRRKVPPLHGWYLVDCEGELRWAHPVVLEMLLDARDRAEKRRLSTEGRSVAKRVERMVKALAGMGVDKSILANQALVEAMDHWLEENWKRSRTSEAYARVLNWAVQEGLLSGARKNNGLR